MEIEGRLIDDMGPRRFVQIGGIDKKEVFLQIATEIPEEGGVLKANVWINLVDTGREDWSFGTAEMQYWPQ
jgi:hypothetical protein